MNNKFFEHLKYKLETFFDLDKFIKKKIKYSFNKRSISINQLDTFKLRCLKILEKFKLFDFSQILLIFIKNSLNETIFIGGVTFLFHDKTPTLLSSKLHDAFKKLTKISSFELDTICAINIFKDNSEFKINYIDKFFNKKIFDLLRSVGINIPLIIVQNHFKRIFDTFYFVSDKNINYLNNRINYTFFNKIRFLYIDLDETLIWSATGKSIFSTLDLIINIRKKTNISVLLLTRHKKIIKESLNNALIDPSLFDEIILVPDCKKKSEFIQNSSLTIDNDFSERYDIYITTGNIALNIDQIDFINLNFK